jgi:predicted alpha/beta superfamily hydrolase
MQQRDGALLLTILGALLSRPATLTAQRAVDYQVPFVAEQIDLPVSANGVAYRLFVRRPIREPAPGEKPITIYVLDAQWNFPAIAAMHANIEALGHVPPVYYIGVGYQDESRGEVHERNRTRDYTPTSFRPAEPKTHFLQPRDYEGSGGGDAFLNVLEREIIPFVERRFVVDPSVRGLVGKSMSGLLATPALLTRPALFSHYLIISPALWWDDYFLDHAQRAVMRAERGSHATRLARPTKVWIGMGGGEERLGMLADVYLLGRALRLRNDSSLTLTIQQIPGITHEEMFPFGFAAGFPALFSNRR